MFKREFHEHSIKGTCIYPNLWNPPRYGTYESRSAFFASVSLPSSAEFNACNACTAEALSHTTSSVSRRRVGIQALGM